MRPTDPLRFEPPRRYCDCGRELSPGDALYLACADCREALAQPERPVVWGGLLSGWPREVA